MVKDINCLIEGRNLFDSNKYLFGPKIFCLNQKNFVSLRYFLSTKSKPQAKIDNFAFKNNNIVTEGLFWKRKD